MGMNRNVIARSLEFLLLLLVFLLASRSFISLIALGHCLGCGFAILLNDQVEWPNSTIRLGRNVSCDIACDIYSGDLMACS